MKDKKLEKLIKEIFKDVALRLCELNYEDRNSLLDEYREWIHEDLEQEKILTFYFNFKSFIGIRKFRKRYFRRKKERDA